MLKCTIVPGRFVAVLALEAIASLLAHKTLKFGLFFTGARASFKSTQAEILGHTANSDSVIATDTSTALKHHKENVTDIGKEIMRYDDHVAAGGLLPADLVFLAVYTYLCTLEKYASVQLLILAGSPRSPEELKMWLEVLGVNMYAVYMRNTWPDVIRWAKIRDTQSRTPRLDTKPEALKNNWDTFHMVTMKAIDKCHDLRILYVCESSTPPLQRTRDIIKVMTLHDETQRVRWTKRLLLKAHPGRMRIEQIEARTGLKYIEPDRPRFDSMAPVFSGGLAALRIQGATAPTR